MLKRIIKDPDGKIRTEEVPFDQAIQEIFKPVQPTRELSPEYLGELKINELVGLVKFTLAGLYTPHDTEFLETDDGKVFPHNFIFRSYVGKWVRVTIDDQAEHGLRVEERTK